MRRAAPLAMGILCTLAACGGEAERSPAAGKRVSESDLGRAWPLTVKTGRLRCEKKGAVIFSVSRRSEYAVSASAAERGLPSLEPIWKRDPSDRSRWMDITPLLERGLRLCDPPQGNVSAARREASEKIQKLRRGDPP